MSRHTHDIATHLEEQAVDWELNNALADALGWLDLTPDLLSTRPFMMARMQFATEPSELLQAERNLNLALYLKTELGISDANYLRLRLAMCKEYKDGRWKRRLWFHDK
eukprot:4750114-Pleurochrysis_carterae.AAC.1